MRRANGAGTPEMVGEKIREIVATDTGKFHHPVGPDAEPLLGWRASMNDEQWTDNHAVDDETWLANARQSFGMDLRLDKTAGGAA